MGNSAACFLTERIDQATPANNEAPPRQQTISRPRESSFFSLCKNESITAA